MGNFMNKQTISVEFKEIPVDDDDMETACIDCNDLTDDGSFISVTISIGIPFNFDDEMCEQIVKTEYIMYKK
jgi:hypothetical protein